MKNNSLGTKVLMAAVALLLMAYFGVQAYLYFNDPLSTTLAYNYQVEKEVTLSGWVIRTEEVLGDSGGGLLQLQRQEGERVSKGGVVAQVYTDQAALDAQAQITALTTRLEQLQYAKEASASAEVALKLDAQIQQSILDHRSFVAAGQFSKAETEGSQLRSLVLKRDYSFSEDEDFDARIEELETQVKSLSKQAAGSVRKVTAPRSGLYSAVVDGYETVLTPAVLAELTPAQLANVQADSSVDSDVGKLILGDAWYYAAVMDTEEALKLQERSKQLALIGQTLTLRYAKSIERDLPVTVAFVGPDEEGRSVVTFRGETYLPQLTLLRHQSAQVVHEIIEGVRVPTEALRISYQTETAEDGTQQETKIMGVYCMMGMEARFKPVELLYSGEGFALVRPTAPADRETLVLRPGDEVIVAARNLYDGKVME